MWWPQLLLSPTRWSPPMRDAIDFSFARPTPQAVSDLNLDILVYTGNARPDKAYLDAMRAAGVAVTLIQESDPNRAQQGYNAGVADAQYADSRADEVGYPNHASIAYVVSDGSATNPSTGGDAIAAYAKGVQDTSRRPFFFYGNQYAVDNAVSGANRALGSWVPSTWGTATLLRQEANLASPIPDTDLNTVHQEYAAWGQGVPTPTPPKEDDDDMPHFAYLRNLDGTTAQMLVDGARMTHDFGVAAANAPFGLTKEYLDWRAEEPEQRGALKSLRYNGTEWAAVRKYSGVA